MSLVSKHRFRKFFGKYITYIGELMGIAGIVFLNGTLFIYGIFMVTVGCILHEYSEE